MARDPFPTILNEYKYTLTRRRLLQTLTGGVRIQSLPVSLHLLQWLLWILPFGISFPFVATANLWNVYYLGLISSTLCGLLTLALGCTIKLIYWKSRVEPSTIDDEEEEDVMISSLLSTATLCLIFPRKNWADVFVHAASSILVCYSSIIILNPYIMKDVVSVAATPFLFIAGALTFCTAHYSLVAKPPNELSIYRQFHQDRLHLYYLRRPVYVVLIGITFVLLRSLVENSSFLIVPYVLHSLLPLLWVFSVLPPLDALLFWIVEQVLIHLMGGSGAASELRLLAQFLLGIVPTIGIVWITDRFILSLIATGLGLLLSQNIVHWVILASYPFIRRIFSVSDYRINNSWYASYYIVDFRQVKTIVGAATVLLASFLKIVILVAVGVAITSQTYGRGHGTPTRERVARGVSYAVIGMFVFIKGSRIFTGPFLLCGLIRNFFHRWKIEPLSSLKKRNLLSIYLSYPNQLLTLYVGPLLMIAYVGLLLDTNRTSNDIWFGITTIRAYRKIWQSSSSCLTELTITAILFLSLSSDSSWSSLGIGTQALLVSAAMYIGSNLMDRLKLFLILFVSFITNCSHNPVYFKCLILSFLLIPFSVVSVLLSALISAPLTPIFTLPILITSFPRPQTFWPSLFNPKSLSQTYESSYYKQALPAISKSVSHIFRTGALNTVTPATSLLVRFQDRLSLVRVVERGHGYCLMLIQGLELQETSCHTTEAACIDDIYETLYTRNTRNCSYWWFNRYPLHHLQPIDVSVGLVYSDARNSLTGIIDRHSSLKKFSLNLYKTLIWVFASYVSEDSVSVAKPKVTSGVWNEMRDIGDSDSNHSITDGASSVISPSHITCRSAKIHPSSSPPSLSFKLPSSLPLTEAELSRVSASFPSDWFKQVVSKHCKIEQSTMLSLKALITTCYVLTDVPASNAVFKTFLSSRTQPGHVYRGFCGDYATPLGMNANAYRKWMKENSQVEKLTNKAYRYAVKLLYDEAILGEMTDNDELLETLEDYDTNWFIGREGTAGEWERNVVEEKCSLFSMGLSENCYTAHVLTLQDEPMFLGQLNHSLIEGIWSNLSFELQYLTNDDEERYSIQAQPRLLRNLITQGAEVPYGYQIFSSDLITIPAV